MTDVIEKRRVFPILHAFFFFQASCSNCFSTQKQQLGVLVFGMHVPGQVPQTGRTSFDLNARYEGSWLFSASTPPAGGVNYGKKRLGATIF